jgi:tetratricopeptide (TPR) repeat protein
VVFNFVVNSDPGLVPPAVGTWAADQFASSWGGTYEIVERGELCWYMGRLGLTMRDVLGDAGARRSLAQALNVQVFAFGTIQQTASFDVKTHLIDADTGVRTGGGMIHVQDHNELKLRMRELVGQSHAAPAEQARLEQAGKRSERALDDAIRLRKGGKFAEAASVARAGLKDDPHSAALQIVLQQSEDDERRAKLEAARRQETAKLAEEAAAARKRQEKIAAELTAARERAVKEAKSQDEAARRAEEAKKTRAAEVLRTTGERALKERRYSDAVQALQSAAALAPKDAAVQKALTQARDAAKGEREARLAEEQRQAQAAELKRKADEQAKVLALKKAQAEADAARAKAKEERDKALARQQEEARRPTVPAETKPVADAKAKKLKEDFELAMSAGKAASAQKNYAGAVNAYKEALRLQPTDVAAAAALRESQRLATETAADNKAAAEAEARRKAEETKRNADFAKLVGDGQAALSAKRYADAAKVYGEALKLKPNDPAATQGLNQARAALDTPKPTPPPPATTAKPAPAPPPPPAAPSNAAVYAKAMQDGAAFDKAKKFSDAVKAYREALRVQPNDARAAAALKSADAAAHYAEGQRLQAAKKYPEAVKEYEEVLKLKPDDADAKAALKRAKDGKP